MENLENIKFSFLSGIPVKSIDFKDLLVNLAWDDQEIFIRQTIMHERNAKFPLRKDYQIAFIKHVIHQLEANGTAEIHDKFYEVLADKIKEADAEFSYKHFQIAGNDLISLKESNSFIRDGTTGLKLWPAAVALSNFILLNPDDFNGKSILEIGSGCSGLVGLTLLKSCSCKQIFLSDCHDSVVSNLIENVNLNLEGCEVEKLESSLLTRQHLRVKKSCELGILNLPWEEVEDNQNELLQKCHLDMILAADVVYDSSIFEALVKCLNVLFKIYSDSSLQFILSQTIRNNETFDNFSKYLGDNSFNVEELSFEKLEHKILYSNDASADVKIFKITKQKFKNR